MDVLVPPSYDEVNILEGPDRGEDEEYKGDGDFEIRPKILARFQLFAEGSLLPATLRDVVLTGCFVRPGSFLLLGVAERHGPNLYDI